MSQSQKEFMKRYNNAVMLKTMSDMRKAEAEDYTRKHITPTVRDKGAIIFKKSMPKSMKKMTKSMKKFLKRHKKKN